MPSDIQPILDRVAAYLPKANLTRIEAAYQCAKAAHEGQLRFSGEPYITHPVAATERLLMLEPDEDSIVACLLHDVVEDTETDLETIQEQFGPEVARLCSGLEKLGKVRFQGAERQVENLRKMFVSMAVDLRVIFIKLADRLHNMETLGFVRPEKRERIARETLEVYAPIAARLGIYEFKSRLEDIAFQILYPAEYAKIAQAVSGTAETRKKFVETATAELAEKLQEAKVHAKVTGRTKHLYSIWKKMSEKGYASLDEIYDLFALRVLVHTPAECYTTLGVIHNSFTPLSNRFKDFIAVPKVNGYKSLHTTVLGIGRGLRTQPTEIQIRTYAMHADAERGAAAHWNYSEKKKSTVADEQKLKWVQGLVDLHDRLKDNKELVETLALDTFSDRIFVMTPKGDVKDLPDGATSVDFAYAVHTQVGHMMIGAKVNGKIAPLDRKLKNGDVIEILTRKDGKPNRFWLSFVKTEGARTKIKAYFNALDHEENVNAGKEILNKQLARLGKDKLDTEYAILKNYKGGNLNAKERESIIERIGNGSIAVGAVVRDLFPMSELTVKEVKYKPAAASAAVAKKGEIVIAGEVGLMYQLAKCCKPVEGVPITALTTTRRDGASIHRSDCKQLAKSNPERRLTARWGGEKECQLIPIVLAGENRVGMLRDIAAVIAESEINIADVALGRSEKHELTHTFTLEICDLGELALLIERIEQIPGIRSVTSMTAVKKAKK